MNKLISFLGTSNYHEVYYVFNGETTKQKYRFVQEALIEFFGNEWNDNVEIDIFMTEAARNKNWLGKNESPEAHYDTGLKDELSKFIRSLNKNFTVKDIKIPDGKSEEELWEIFSKIDERIKEDGSIIFDVSHGFRAIPLISLFLLYYLKVIKNIKIEKILYGFADTSSSNENKGQIFDLTPMWNLMEWSVAVERFLETGNANKIKELAEKELNTQRHRGGNVRQSIDSLNNFTESVLTSRGPKFKKDIDKIENLLPYAKKDLEAFKLPGLGLKLGHLLEKVENRFSQMNCSDELSCELEVSRWCFENGYVQQGLTILRETLVNYVMLKILNLTDDKLIDKKSRDEAEEMLNESAEEKRGKAEEESNKIANEELMGKIEEMPDNKISDNLIDLWSEVIELRNDIDHAGWRKGSKEARTFKERLKNIIEKLNSIIKEQQSPQP